MFFDTAKIRGNALVIHRNSFLLDRITAADVQRPLLSISAIPAAGAGAFCFAFFDILYAGEIATIACSAVLSLIGGANIAQLKLVSSDLRGSEVSGAVWSSYRHLRNIHAEINSVWNPKDVSDDTL
ncbi:MAG: hypothetical protein ACSHXB_19295 [Sulfitobacter sp.]